MDLEHKVLIVRGDEEAKTLENALNDGFVALRADRMGEHVVFTLAKAVKGKSTVVAPAGAIPFPQDILDGGNKGSKRP